MTITPHNIFDLRGKQVTATRGRLMFSLRESGWNVRWFPFQPLDGPVLLPEGIEDADVWAACRFANDRIQDTALRVGDIVLLNDRRFTVVDTDGTTTRVVGTTGVEIEAREIDCLYVDRGVALNTKAGE